MPEQNDFQTKFDEALAQLSKKNYKEGIDALAAIRDKGFVSGDLEANLGRALFEAGQTGPGIEHLMNSVALDRWNSRNRADLQLAQSKVEGGLGVPSSHPAEIGNRIASYIRPLESLSIASIFLLALFALVLFQKINRKRMLGFGFAVLMFLGMGIFGQYGSSIYVVVKDADLRSAPLESSEPIQTLKSGTRLQVLHVSGAFAEVERSNIPRGWIKSDTLVKSPY